ncbi:MAG: hypothetical protein LBV65_02795, partial [Desulfovibrio sp.]|nr:hypothetical protein [Desulfovibrio sp.]
LTQKTAHVFAAGGKNIRHIILLKHLIRSRVAYVFLGSCLAESVFSEHFETHWADILLPGEAPLPPEGSVIHLQQTF